MTTDDKIRGEKLQYDINREAAKTSALSSGKIDKYEYLTGEEILPPDQSRKIEQAKFTYTPLEKAFEKQTKTIEEQGQKQIKTLEVLKPEENKEEEIKSVEGLFLKEMRTNEIKNEIHKMEKWEELIKRKDLKYETNKYRFDFQQFETIRPFGDSFHNDKIIIKEAEKKQNNLFKNTLNFNNKSILKSIKDKKKILLIV